MADDLCHNINSIVIIKLIIRASYVLASNENFLIYS